MTYSFTADNPGTYLYESGTNPEKQVRMGLFGALIVRPAGDAGPGLRLAPTARFTPSEEFMVLLSEIDPYQHQAVEQGKSFNIEQLPPALLADQRPRLPRQHRRQRRLLAADAALRRAGGDP